MTYDDDFKPTKTEKEPIIAKVITAKRKGPEPVTQAKTLPLTLSFSEGAVAGTIKFVKAGDVYQDNNGKQQRYGQTKIVIKTTQMKDPFTINEPLYRFMMVAFVDEDAVLKISEWLT